MKMYNILWVAANAASYNSSNGSKTVQAYNIQDLVQRFNHDFPGAELIYIEKIEDDVPDLSLISTDLSHIFKTRSHNVISKRPLILLMKDGSYIAAKIIGLGLVLSAEGRIKRYLIDQWAYRDEVPQHILDQVIPAKREYLTVQKTHQSSQEGFLCAE